MRIIVDLDGVVYDWDSAARYMLREYRGYGAALLDPSSSWDHIQEVVTKEDWDWLWTTGVQKGLFRYGHIVRGAIIGVRTLAEAGHEILIATHRPRSAVRDTVDFLSYAHLPLSEIHILSDGEPKSSIRADILIDDKPDNVNTWTHGPAILFDRPHNQGYPDNTWVTRASDWRKVVQLVGVLRPFGAGRNHQHLRRDAASNYQGRWTQASKGREAIVEG